LLSPVIDQILAELVQAGVNTLCYGIYKVINCIWNKEELPEQCKESFVLTIYKESDRTDCSNYQGISPLSTTDRILSIILLSSFLPFVDEIVGDHQCGFQHNLSTTDQIFCIHLILEKKWEYNGTVH
jgi:hypothetical protein